MIVAPTFQSLPTEDGPEAGTAVAGEAEAATEGQSPVVVSLLFQLRRKPKGGALARLAVHTHFALHQCRQLLSERKAQAGASVFTRARPIDLAKRLKELPLSFG